MAKKLGIDPAEYRRINFMQDGDHFPVGESIAHVKAAETLKQALEGVGVSHGQSKERGAAVAR